MKPLTNVQQEILTYIKTYISEVGYSPSFKDIKEHRGYSSENAVRDHLISLTKKGYINTTDGVPRSIVVLTESNGWISVDDDLPPKSDSIRTQTVLLWCSGQCQSPFTLGYGIMVDGVNYPFTIKQWKSTDSGCDIIYGDVTHWQPLPQPPTT